MDNRNTDLSEELFYLADENGEEMAFHLLDVVLYREREYLLLLPAEGPFVDEVVILQRYRDENGEDSYADPEDPADLQAVYNLFRERSGDRFIFSD